MVFSHLHVSIKGRFGVLRRFQQLRSYRDEIETRNLEEIPLSLQKVQGDIQLQKDHRQPSTTSHIIEQPGKSAIVRTQRRLQPANSCSGARCHNHLATADPLPINPLRVSHNLSNNFDAFSLLSDLRELIGYMKLYLSFLPGSNITSGMILFHFPLLSQ